MSRVLVTGATGQDGGYLVDRLVGDGHEVVALVRDVTGPLPTSVERVVADLADAASLTDAVRQAEPSVIYNLAGVSSVARSWSEPTHTIAVTGAAVGVLLEAAWQQQESTGKPVRFLQASSAEIFAGTTQVPQTESTPFAPANPYGAAKALASNLVSVYRARGLFAASAFLYNHESPERPEGFVTRKITAAAAKIAAGLQDELVLGDLDVRRDWGWAPDYVDAMVRIASAERPDDFVVATGESHSIREFVALAFGEAGVGDWQGRVRSDPSFVRPTDAAELRGDSSKLRRELGWAPTVTFEEMVRRMVRNDMRLVEGLSS